MKEMLQKIHKILEALRDRRFYRSLKNDYHMDMQILLDREHESQGFTHEFCEYSAQHNWPSYVRFGFNYHREK